MLMNSGEYLTTIEQVKQEIKAAQYRATLHANAELVLLYHSIGCVINAHKEWGNKFIDNLATDLRLEFPDSKGYSVRNLKYMAKFAAAYPDKEFVQQAVAQIPWGHNIVLLDKISNPKERIWYIETCRKNGWSRAVLIHQIESGLYQRQVLSEKTSNFEMRLPSPQSELAVQAMKDPYVFDFIPFRADMVERDIEDALVRDVTKLLLELGTGFAFLGNQYHLNVGGDDFYIDLPRCVLHGSVRNGIPAEHFCPAMSFAVTAVAAFLRLPLESPITQRRLELTSASLFTSAITAHSTNRSMTVPPPIGQKRWMR